jgi:ubiquinone/menaquinone biosynthesis C-methylase UbiE
MSAKAWSGRQVRESFNDIPSVLYYTRAAHFLGLWASERLLIDRFFPDKDMDLLEAGCGAGRVSMGLWRLGYKSITAFDFADELLDQARSLAAEKGATDIAFTVADATKVDRRALPRVPDGGFAGALFMFNGLMQIPGRRNRRSALASLHALCRPGAPLMFTSHDREQSGAEAGYWKAERKRWDDGEQDPMLSDFGDRRFRDESGEVFITIPSRKEVLGDLESAGWIPHFDAMRSELSTESPQVVSFSDNCRFWVALRGP